MRRWILADGSGFGLGALRAEAPHALRESADETVRGILVVALAYLAFTVGDVAGKWALVAAGVSGVMLGRGVFGALTVAGLAVAEGDWRRLLPVRRGMVALRSLLHGAVSVTWYVAWTQMALADVYAIGFIMPLLMALLAVPMLGERLHWRRMVSITVGFGGVLLMVRPGGELWTVFNSRLGHAGALRRIVGSTKVMGDNGKFTVTRSIKQPTRGESGAAR